MNLNSAAAPSAAIVPDAWAMPMNPVSCLGEASPRNSPRSVLKTRPADSRLWW